MGKELVWDELGALAATIIGLAVIRPLWALWKKMRKRDNPKKFWSRPWVIAIGGTAIGTTIASIAIKVNLFIEALKLFIKFLKLIGKFFALPVSLQVWSLILLISSIPIIILILVLLIPKKKETGPSPYDEYRKDIFDGVIFRWVWEYNKFGKRYSIEKLSPFCPDCDCQLNVSDHGGLYCPSCGFRKSEMSKSRSDLEILIFHNLRKKYFPDQ